MAFNKNKKIVTTALTAAMVASAVAPVAAAKVSVQQDATNKVNSYSKAVVRNTAEAKKAEGLQKAAQAAVAKLTSKKDANLKKSLQSKINAKAAAIKSVLANITAADKAVKAYEATNVKVEADYAKTATAKNNATKAVAKLVDASAKASYTKRINNKATALKAAYDKLVAARTEAAAQKAVEEALKAAQALKVDEKTTQEQVDALYKTGKDLISKVKDAAKKAQYTATLEKLYKDATDQVKFFATPQVASVTAINAKEVVVKFTKAVDENNLGTYTFSDGKLATAELQEDGKSVLLTLNTAYDNAAHSVAVTVQGAKVAGTVDTLFPIYTGVISVNDTTKAEISGVTAVTNGNSVTSFTVDFSEPVAPGAVFKVDGASVNSASLNVGGKSATITASSALAVGSTHKIEVINLTDLAGNVNAIASKDFTITKDVAAPVVSSVEAKGDNQLLVTFSKNMKNDAAARTVLANNIKVKNDVYNDVHIASVTPVDGTSKTQFVVQLDKVDAAALFSSSKTSHNLTVLFVDGQIQDYLGNTLAGTTKTATISKDTVAPEVTGVTYKKNSSGDVTDVVVSFSEGLKANATLAFPSSLVNENGVVVTTDSVFGTGNLGTANVADGAKSATFHLATAKTITGKYSVAFASAWVKDTSLAGNDSKAYQTVIDFGAAQVAGDYTIAAGSVTNSGTNQIQVVFPEAVKGGAVAGSATDASRYTINGKSLPAGTTITLNAAVAGPPAVAAQTIATITLPAGTIDTTDTAAIFTINGVQTLTGKTNKAFTKAVVITDNVKPVLQSARVLDNKTIELTYSEALDALANVNVGSEFTIYQGTTALTLTDAQLVGNTVGGFPTKLRLTVAQGADTPAVTEAHSVTGAAAGKVALSGSSTATGSKAFTVADNGSGVLEVKDGGTVVATLTAGNGSFTFNGVLVTVTGAVDTDTFTVSTTAAVAATSATTLDLTKDLKVVTGAGVDVDDVAHNLQAADVTVTVSK